MKTIKIDVIWPTNIYVQVQLFLLDFFFYLQFFLIKSLIQLQI